MKNQEKKAGESRRGFLRLAGFGSVAAGAALVAGTAETEAAEPVSETAAGYRETAHVRKAYETARF